MWPSLLTSILPALVLAGLLGWFIHGNARRTSRRQQLFGQRQEEQERELADMERRVRQILQNLSHDQQQSQEQDEQRYRELNRRCEVLEKDRDMLMSKLDQVHQKAGNQDPTTPATAESPQIKEVVDLLQKGMGHEEIARQTGVQVGEIDLIKGLKHYLSKDGTGP